MDIPQGIARKINPAAAHDIVEMNKLLKSQDDYIEGLLFNDHEVKEDGSIQFLYDHPDTFTELEEEKAKIIVARVHKKFMEDKHNK
ncbi:hypothetical protein ACRTEU_16110 [Vibrio alginolyticus]|uniref:hypothetical protein n=1 Tax=Vibrio alginolyticus TaxID=663 RepID=UPI001BD47AD5|nr:hypothetical protein [Vibrio alginolyticus]MBT0012170.1 hypothetical protein [Vibrio alginolyticus]MBT0039893.1 hypothetical protein [Vibrio alginolyticus]